MRKFRKQYMHGSSCLHLHRKRVLKKYEKYKILVNLIVMIIKCYTRTFTYIHVFYSVNNSLCTTKISKYTSSFTYVCMDIFKISVTRNDPYILIDVSLKKTVLN